MGRCALPISVLPSPRLNTHYSYGQSKLYRAEIWICELTDLLEVMLTRLGNIAGDAKNIHIYFLKISTDGQARVY